MKSRKLFMLFVWGLLLSACQQPVTPSITPTVTSIQTPTSPTSTPEVYVTVLVVTQEQPTATPDFLSKNIENGILAETDVPNCELPCWLGLRIGESTKEDVQRVFTEAFFLDEPYDFFDESLWSEDYNLSALDHLDNLEAGGYEWYGENRNLRYAAIVNEESELLDSIVIRYDSRVIFWSPPTMQEIIQQVGTPDAIVGYKPRLAVDLTQTQLIYEQGLVFSIFYENRAILDEQGNPRTKQVCLDTRISGTDIIINSFEVGTIPNVVPGTPVTRYFGINEEDHVSSEEAFGLTPEEFAAYAFENVPCFEIDESLFESP